MMDKVIFNFPVLWKAWEGDDEAWIMERPDKTRYIKMTNHGVEYIASTQDLIEKIEEYQSVIAETVKAISISNGIDL